MLTLELTEEQHADLERILENEKRVQEESGDAPSPMVVLFYPEDADETE